MFTQSSFMFVTRLMSAMAGAVLLALILSAPAAWSATFTVGGDVACTHASVQAAVNTAQALPESSVIRIARNRAHQQQGVVVNASRRLDLTGGYATCAQTTADSVKTTLDGAGGNLLSVLRIIAATDVTVTVRKLRIQNGDPMGWSNGGGIFFGGNGILEIHDSDVLNNHGANGGGIYAGGSGMDAELIIGADVVISGNEAVFSGGGVFVDGLKMTMVEPGSMIFGNSALGTPDTGYGGGLFVRGLGNPARPGIARIGSGGMGTLGAISNNEARAGGGVAVLGNENNLAKLELFTTAPAAPAAIRDNWATVAGGGVFVQSHSDTGYGRALVWNAEITGNASPSGAAVYLANDGDGASLFINTNFPEPLPNGALSCTYVLPCGAIQDNVAQSANGELTDGAIIQFQREASGTIGSLLSGIEFSGNRGGRLIDVQPDGELNLSNALVFHNEFSQHLLRAQGDLVRIHESTIADNAIGSGNVLALNADLVLRNSILWQPGMTSLSRSGGTLVVTHVIANETASLGGAPFAIDVDPRFIDAAAGDYRLSVNSPAIDFAPPLFAGSDITGSVRDVDLPFKPNADGPRDIGAFERQGTGELIANDTFDTGIEHYVLVTPGSTVWDETQNTGAMPSGSAKVAGSLDLGTRLIGATRCIHLPGPGRYKLNGFGMTSFALFPQRDSVILHWGLRHDGGEACVNGIPDAEGDHLLSRSTSFLTPAQPAVIVVEPEAWTVNSSITVSLVVVDNGIAFPANVTGWFDRITLTETPFSDVIFANGFQFGENADP